MIVHFSRSHMKAKNGRTARPKFHVFFPIEECTGAEEYAAMKQRVYEYFPYFDAQALDAARFFFGTENPEIECYEGTLLSEYLPLPSPHGEDHDARPDVRRSQLAGPPVTVTDEVFVRGKYRYGRKV